MNPQETTALSGLIKASSNHLYSEVGEEAVILDINSGVYYGLNPVGVDIWNWLQEPKTADELLELLLAEYDVTKEQAHQDLIDILQKMLNSGLIEAVSLENV